MGLGDWEVKNTTQLGVSLDVSTPIDGSGSLAVTSVATGSVNQGASITLSAVTDPDRGHERGRIRTLVKNVTGSATQIIGGIFCLADSPNWALTTGLAYFASVNSSTGAFRLEHGVSFTAGTNIVATYAQGYTLGTTIAMELEWHRSATDIGGVYLIGRTGAALDFSDLTERWTYAADIPLGAFTGYEGIYMLRDTGSTGSFSYDKTSVFSIT